MDREESRLGSTGLKKVVYLLDWVVSELSKWVNVFKVPKAGDYYLILYCVFLSFFDI